MNNEGKNKKRIITVPNILSLFRLCLIPVIIWLYCVKKNYLWTTVILLLSGLTDAADGIIARRFNMISDLGKMIDPVADKLTQIATLFCLVSRFRYMLIPFVVLTVKEIIAAVLNMLAMKKTGNVTGALWHGKVNTFLLYTMMLIHLVWYNIPAAVSNILIFVCTAMMVVSAVLYGIRSVRILASGAENGSAAEAHKCKQ